MAVRLRMSFGARRQRTWDAPTVQCTRRARGRSGWPRRQIAGALLGHGGPGCRVRAARGMRGVGTAPGCGNRRGNERHARAPASRRSALGRPAELGGAERPLSLRRPRGNGRRWRILFAHQSAGASTAVHSYPQRARPRASPPHARRRWAARLARPGRTLRTLRGPARTYPAIALLRDTVVGNSSRVSGNCLHGDRSPLCESCSYFREHSNTLRPTCLARRRHPSLRAALDLQLQPGGALRVV